MSFPTRSALASVTVHLPECNIICSGTAPRLEGQRGVSRGNIRAMDQNKLPARHIRQVLRNGTSVHLPDR